MGFLDFGRIDFTRTQDGLAFWALFLNLHILPLEKFGNDCPK